MHAKSYIAEGSPVMKFLPIMSAIFFMATSQAHAQNFWIPADRFDEHTNRGLEGTLISDPDFEFRTVNLLQDDEQVRIILGQDPVLEEFLEANPNFKVCAFMANAGDGQSNTVIVRHKNFPASERFVLENENYQNRCSEAATINEDRVLSSGLKVLSPSDGAVMVRGISLRPVQAEEDQQIDEEQLVADYEESRALGYLFGDGGITSDGEGLFFRNSGFTIARHFESVASNFFGEAFSLNSQETRFVVRPENISAEDFLLNGPESISDPNAFLASIMETEGSLSGEILDDEHFSRCEFIENLVNDMNPVCATDTFAPNCAETRRFFNRNTETGQFCTVRLTGNRTNFTEKFSSPAFNFVRCNRVPGFPDLCVENPVDSRPSLDDF